MSDEPLDPELLSRAIFDRRWTALTRAGIDLGQITTWDPNLDRRTRLLVPMDVQAFVVPRTGGEKTVPVTGGKGDPAPFAEGSVRPAGVHLHWAMPDALLRGSQVPSAAGDPNDTRLDFPPLPDRWVVVRALFPTGRSQALLRGWVIDAPAGSVMPLADYRGTPAPAPGVPRFDPLDAARGGSLMWTASYSASAGRFGFHDPLDDLPDAALAGDQGVYVVAGWWDDLAQDPMAQRPGRSRLDDKLRELGWLVVHDADDQVSRQEDPRFSRLRKQIGLESPDPAPPVEARAADGKVVKTLADLELGAAVPVEAAEKVLVGPPQPTYASLIHGAVLGVPIGATLPTVDDRPPAQELSVALGLDVDDLVAAFGKDALGPDPDDRLAVEHLAAAFTSDLLDRLGSSDGIADLEEREHGDQFASRPGKPIPGAQPDRLHAEDSAPMSPTKVGRKGRAAAAVGKGSKNVAKNAGQVITGAALRWKNTVDLVATKTGAGATASGVTSSKPRSTPISEAARGADESTTAPAPKVREVVRPPPRQFHPQPVMVAIRGARPNHRHHGDGLHDTSGRLRCRYPGECVAGWEGVVGGEVVVPSLGSGAVPEEVLRIVREAVVLNPYAHDWLAAAGARNEDPQRAKVFRTRLAGEMVRLYGVDGRYDGSTHLPAPGQPPAGSWAAVSQTKVLVDRQLTGALAEFSVLAGTPPSPVAITTWRQPWIPLWVEWRVKLEGAADVAGWTLQGLDLAPPETPAVDQSFTFVGRNPTGIGLSTALEQSIRRWLSAEALREAASPAQSQLSDADELALARFGDFLHPLDLVSASLDGIREQLLGIDYVGCAEYGAPGADGKSFPVAARPPTPLFGGTLRVEEMRLVDAFGRVLLVPVQSVATTSELEVPELPGIRLRPRLQQGARWLFRLVDPALPPDADPTTAKEAFVDQVDPALAVNPVAGFLLPDHIDEALEVFSVAGEPLGQLGHDPVSGAVTWEPAPGRALPPDAGPLAGLGAHERIVGELASALVQADVATRGASEPPAASALTALLRAVDTTLWSVDTFAAVGSSTVAGLVGRPVAVVRATLRLEAPDDLDEVTVTHAGGAEVRRALFAALAEQRFPVQLGTLQRSDDSLLGFFVDDDYRHLHLVDKVVAASALESGRHRGQLGLLGEATHPAVEPLDHPYVVTDDVLWIRPGQTMRLTLLMLPAGKVHLTSGILPRKALALGDDWVGSGLARLMPSVRVGPVLVDPSEIRLPLVHLLGDRQTFTRRTGPLTWRDDPILAATQTALLPRLPHEAQEGWIRVSPEDPESEP